jgi:probable O-glycosylation ligase (exosortase A-associated)
MAFSMESVQGGTNAWPEDIPVGRTRAWRRPTRTVSWQREDAIGGEVVEPAPPRSPLRGVRWTLLYAAFLLYIFVVTTYQLGIADLAMLAALGGFLFQREPLRLSPVLVWLGLFLAWNAVGFVRSDQPALVWEQLTLLVKLWLVSLVVVNALRSRSQVFLFIIVFAGSFALYPLRGAMFNYYVYHSSIFGRAQWNFIYSNPNDLAALALLQLSLVAALLVTGVRGWIRVAAVVGIGMLPVLILMTQSRGAFVALCIFTAFALLGPRSHPREPSRSRRRRLVAFGVIGALVVFVAPSGVWDRVHGLKAVSNTDRLEDADREGSAKQRFEIWKVATRMINEHPLSGVGLGVYGVAHEGYVQRGGFDLTAGGKKDAHNTFLKITAETGIPGLLLFLGLIVSTGFGAERVRRLSRRTLPRSSAQLFYLEVGLLAFLVAGIFGSFYHLSFLYIHIALLWVMTVIVEQELATARRSRWRVSSGA